jgi:hypothetical protein
MFSRINNVCQNCHVLNPEQKLYWLLNNENEEILRRTSWRKYVMLLPNYRVHQATVKRYVKMNQEEIQIKPSNMCFSLNLFYLFRNIINLYYISPF